MVFSASRAVRTRGVRKPCPPRLPCLEAGRTRTDGTNERTSRSHAKNWFSPATAASASASVRKNLACSPSKLEFSFPETHLHRATKRKEGGREGSQERMRKRKPITAGRRMWIARTSECGFVLSLARIYVFNGRYSNIFNGQAAIASQDSRL